MVFTEELEVEGYASNPTDRCYFCKTELFNKLNPISEKYQIGTIVYGAIPDDVGDHRPGMDAAKQMGIQAPLIDANLWKADIRAISKQWGLATWDKPLLLASPRAFLTAHESPATCSAKLMMPSNSSTTWESSNFGFGTTKT